MALTLAKTLEDAESALCQIRIGSSTRRQLATSSSSCRVPADMRRTSACSSVCWCRSHPESQWQALLVVKRIGIERLSRLKGIPHNLRGPSARELAQLLEQGVNPRA